MTTEIGILDQVHVVESMLNEMNKLFIGRFVTSIVVVLIATSMSHTHAQNLGLSDADEADVIESLLQLTPKQLDADFGSTTNFSTENISSLSASRIKQHGFSLLSPGEIETTKRDHMVDYVVIRGIKPKDGMVVVSVSVVTEGRPCFAAAFSAQRSFSYVFQKSGEQWIGRLLKGPAPFPFPRSLATPRYSPWKK
jgi:hypothetical protein